MSITANNTTHNLYPRTISCLREIARSFGPVIKNVRTSSVSDVKTERIAWFLDASAMDVKSMISSHIEALQTIEPGYHYYHQMSKEQRADFRRRQEPFVEALFTGLKNDHGVDLSASRLPAHSDYPSLTRILQNELHRADDMGLRMISVVADENDYNAHSLEFAFNLGREFAGRKLLPVVGQSNDFIRSFVRGMSENGGTVIGLFLDTAELPKLFPDTPLSLNIAANVGDLRIPIMGRVGRGLLKIGTSDSFNGDFQNRSTSEKQSAREEQRFSFGAHLVAQNEFIPTFCADPSNAGSIENIRTWLDHLMLPAETGEHVTKYDLLAGKGLPPDKRLFPVSVLGSANIGITCGVKDLSGNSISLGEELAKKGFMNINGAGPGVMLQVSIGAAREKGVSVGIVPGLSYVSSNHSIDVPIVTGIGLSRDCMVAKSSKAVVAFPGCHGTIDEILIAMASRKPIIDYFSPIPEASGYPYLFRAKTIQKIMEDLQTIKDRQ